MHTSSLAKSRHPVNWLPSLRGKKCHKVGNDVNRKNQPKSKEKFAEMAGIIFWYVQ